MRSFDPFSKVIEALTQVGTDLRGPGQRRLTEGPLGSVDLDMEAHGLSAAALEFLRRGDRIGLTYSSTMRSLALAASLTVTTSIQGSRLC